MRLDSIWFHVQYVKLYDRIRLSQLFFGFNVNSASEKIYKKKIRICFFFGVKKKKKIRIGTRLKPYSLGHIVIEPASHKSWIPITISIISANVSNELMIYHWIIFYLTSSLWWTIHKFNRLFR